MRKVFSSVEVSETVLVRDALLHHGIDASIQNQHTGYTAIPVIRIPAEVWIRNAGDLDRAERIVREVITKIDDAVDDEPWTCARCKEPNPQSFDVCWQCEQARRSS